MKRKETKSAHDALIELYLDVKIRDQDEIKQMDNNKLNEEKEALRKCDPFTIIKYIKTSIDIIIDLKVEEKIENSHSEEDNDYETMLRKLEGDVRGHIKLEHQLKLHSDNLQLKIDELENEKEGLAVQNKSLQDVIYYNLRK
jgi:hypothetical protein